MDFKVSVPATTANLGPGYDKLGLALDLRMTASAAPASHWSASLHGEGADALPRDENNLVIQAMCDAWRALGFDGSPHHLEMHNPIPVSRGLGSSATAYVCGLALGWLSAGQPLDQQSIAAMASDWEGHPDNAAPAALGGLRNCGGKMGAWRFPEAPISERVKLLVAIPQVEVSTKQMRGLLPEKYPAEVLAANEDACHKLLAGLAHGNPEGLRYSQQDQLHQPYRLAVQPFSRAIYDLLCDHEQVAGAFLSGSGPTVAGWLLDDADPREELAGLIAQQTDVAVTLMLLQRDRLGVIAV